MTRGILTASLLLLSVAGASAEEPGLRVLILSGLNNHDWQSTTPRLRTIFEDCPRFATVDISESPGTLNAEDFARYDVVVANWTPYPETKRLWPEETERAFLDYVRNGGGFVVFHAASCSFQEWPDFQRIVGLTWKANHTAHGAYHTFRVRMGAITDHPITRGLPDFYTTDELYHNMVQLTDAPMDVLCQAFSAKDQGGTGEDEPMLITTRFGEGRGVNTMLGHDVRAMGTGFRGLILRSAEWAATGAVTIPRPEPWPTTLALAEADGIDAGQAIAAAGAYTHGGDRAPLEQVRRLVAGATSLPPDSGQEYRRELADQLAAGIEDAPRAAAKDFLAEMLARLLPGAEVAHPAKDETLDALLAEAEAKSLGSRPVEAPSLLDKLSSPEQPGTVRAAALRIHARAWPDQAPGLLIEALQGEDSSLVAMALFLARELPGADCSAALGACLASLPEARAELLVRALADRGDAAALPSIEALMESPSAPLRVAAVGALGKLGSDAQTVPLLKAVMEDDKAVRDAALDALTCLRGEQVSDTVAEALWKVAPQLKAPLMAVLVKRNEPSEAVRRDIVFHTNAADDAVRTAAWEAWGALGAPGMYLAALSLLSKEEGGATLAETTEDAVFAGLIKHEPPTAIRDIGVYLRGQAQKKPEVATLCIRLLRRLERDDALPLLREALAAEDEAVRAAAVGALCSWPSPAAMDDAASIARTAGNDAERTMALEALVRLASHPESDKQALGSVLQEAFDLAANDVQRTAVLQALAHVPSPDALQLALSALNVDSLAETAADAAIAIARQVAHDDPDLTQRVVRQIASATVSEALQETSWALLLDPSQSENLAKRAIADSPDGIEADGAAGGDAAANDGDLESYWDEQDHHTGPYRLRLTFPEATAMRALRIVAHWHEDYKPRDFDIVCDGAVVKTIRTAVFGPDHAAALYFPPQKCTTLELLIRQTEGLVSPCIHELEVYNIAPSGKGQGLGETQ